MEKTQIKRLYKLILSLCMILLTINLSGCGDDGELVLVTTESTVSQEGNLGKDTEATPDTAVEEPVATEEAVTEAATDEEKNLTLEDIFYANRGDVLLSGGSGCSINTVYYSAGTEVYSEYSYLGFDEDGNYIQAYEDSDGNMEVLNITNQYWYVVEDGQTYVKIYPEEGVSAVMIDLSHNQLIMPEPQEDSGEVITDIYRMNGMLNVETAYTNNLDEVFSYRYVVDDTLLIKEIYCYDEYGSQMSYAWVTKDAVYNMPENLINLKTSTDNRTITFLFPDGSGYGTTCEVPKGVSIELQLLSSNAYIDESCSTPWVGAGSSTENETIYIKYVQQ